MAITTIKLIFDPEDGSDPVDVELAYVELTNPGTDYRTDPALVPIPESYRVLVEYAYDYLIQDREDSLKKKLWCPTLDESVH